MPCSLDNMARTRKREKRTRREPVLKDVRVDVDLFGSERVFDDDDDNDDADCF